MRVEDFVDLLGCEFFAGVPDSLLKPLCDFLMQRYGLDARHHIIAANEGNAAALAAGYHLATGKVPVVYLQNSGEGNIINPLASLLSEEVYGIPVIFIIGWRGEPGIHDEPQHVFQGKMTLTILEDMGIAYSIINKNGIDDDVEQAMKRLRKNLSVGRQVAFVIRKGALSNGEKISYHNNNALRREEAIRSIVSAVGTDPLVCTTGKASRELFKLREERGEEHVRDFLTVGSMGHNSSIALGIAIQKPERRIWCIDGDGAAIMHLGAMAVIGNAKPGNLVHIVLNNEAHESVGGVPTVAGTMDFAKLALSVGYERAASVADRESLERALADVKASKVLTFLEVKCAIGSQENLGRPTMTPQENKEFFMSSLRKT